MTRSILGALVLLVLFAVPVAAQPLCDQHWIRGTWAYTYEGMLYPFMPDGTLSPTPVPIVLLGIVSIDANGAVTGGGTGVMGTQVIEYEFVNSTVEAGPGCTATGKYSLSVPGMGTVPGQGMDRLVLMPGDDEMRAICVQGVLGRPVYVGTYKRIEATGAARPAAMARPR